MKWHDCDASGREVSRCAEYMVTRTGQGKFTAWVRVPHFERIGDVFDQREQARIACEQHARQAA